MYCHWLLQGFKPYGKPFGLEQAELYIFWLCFELFIYQKCLSFHTKMQKRMLAMIAICSYFQS